MTTHRKPSGRLDGMRESQIREMTRLALECDAINLSQGFPDFDPPEEVQEAAARAVRDGVNQYTVTWGTPALRQAIATSLRDRYQPAFDWLDPDRHVTVTCGVTEAIVSVLMSVIEDGDEVLIIEPAHENYGPATRFAGGTPVFVPLLPPDYPLDIERVRAAVTARTKVILVNTPNNPTGRVFTQRELESIADLVREHDLLVVTDEIYDRILYDGRPHIPIATLAGMDERTITVGGLGKTFAMTGWRLGYAVAYSGWSTALRTIHDFTTICAPAPLQEAAVTALGLPESFYERQLEDYHARRESIMATLATTGFEAAAPEGAYYVLANYRGWNTELNAREFARWLTRTVGVAVVDGPSFYETSGLGEGLVRFAFAKKLETLERVRETLTKGFREFAKG